MIRTHWHLCSPAMFDADGFCFCGWERSRGPSFEYDAGSCNLSYELIEASRIARERLLATIECVPTAHGGKK